MTSTSVHIVGDNIVSALGFSTAENLAALRAYRSGITEKNGILAAYIDREGLQRIGPALADSEFTFLEKLAIVSITDALGQSGIALDSADSLLIISSTKGNVELLADGLSNKVYLWHTAKRIAAYFKAANQPVVISNACISGISALIEGHRLLQTGAFRHAVVCGVDVLSDFICSGFSSFRSLSGKVCRPYDAERNGLNLGEAAATVVLSTVVEGEICIAGGAITNDSNHVSAPSRTGQELADAMQGAMTQAGITAQEVGLLNMHGTATAYNDEMESKAAQRAQLEATPCNGVKSYFGHTLGASGVLETVICAHELLDNIVFGTLNYETNGVPYPLNISAAHRENAATTAIKTASGFGGCNAALVLTKQDIGNYAPHDVALRTTKQCRIAKGVVYVDDEAVFEGSTADFGPFIREAFKNVATPYIRFQKMDAFSRLGFTAVEYLMAGLDNCDGTTAILMANASSSLDTDLRHQEQLVADGFHGTSPATFVYTLPNVMLGEVCIRHGFKGENTFYIAEHYDRAFLLQRAHYLIANRLADRVIIGWCDLLREAYSADISLIEPNLQ